MAEQSMAAASGRVQNLPVAVAAEIRMTKPEIRKNAARTASDFVIRV
jgi:hypothetical protein